MLQAPTTAPKEQAKASRTAIMPEPERLLHPPLSGLALLRHDTRPGLRSASGADQLRQHFAGLQKGIGNRAILRRLSNSAPVLQTKLTVNQPSDPYEQEADRVADQVMRMPDSKLSDLTESFSPTAKLLRKCSCGDSGGSGSCPECAEAKLQRSAHGPSAVSEAPPIVHEVIRSPGQPLDPAARTFMEPRFGRDFSGVRIHTGPMAAKSAGAISAEAYTVDQHVIFAPNRYSPGTEGGRRLLAHELAHIVQHSGQRSVRRFTTGEHIEIGNAAYALAASGFSGPAFKQSPLYLTLLRGSQLPTGSRVKAYGEIVADGDFFQTFEDLIRESGERPGQLGMAVLATRNVHHFTPNNIRAWIPQHDFAVDQMLFAHGQLQYVKDWLANIDPLLQGARSALLRNDDARAERLLSEYQRRFNSQSKRMETIIQSAHGRAQQALARNAFAEHFLTDAFSAGHVVTPRQEILQEAGVRLDQMPSRAGVLRSALLGTTWEELGEVRAQARSLAWHDLDNLYGVEVQDNRLGAAPWIACGDGCSARTSDPHWAATRASVVRATAESIKDLWRAGLTGVRPPDYRAVLDLVPRPTFNNYPGWDASDWQNQLQYIRGDRSRPASGDRLTPFAVELHPIEHCAQPDIGCYEPFLLTAKDWIRQYSFDRWVQPWIGRIRANAATRYRF